MSADMVSSPILIGGATSAAADCKEMFVKTCTGNCLRFEVMASDTQMTIMTRTGKTAILKLDEIDFFGGLNFRQEQELRALMTDADAKIRALMEELGYTIELQQALVCLYSTTAHPATGAANAERLISSIPTSKENIPMENMEKKIKRCLIIIRDIIVLQCLSMCDNSQDREEFLKVMAMAYDEHVIDDEVWKHVRIMSGMSPTANLAQNVQKCGRTVATHMLGKL